MKKVFIIILALLPAMLIAQQTYVPEDSLEQGIVESVWAYEGDGKINNYFYKYDEYGNIIEILKKILFENVFVNTTRVSYHYDSNNQNIIKEIRELFKEDIWKKQAIITNTYNKDGKILISHGEYFHNDVLSKTSRWLYFYDNMGNNIEGLGVVWRDNKWDSTMQWLYDYDDFNNKIVALYRTNNGFYLVNNSLITYEYDKNNRLKSEQLMIFNASKWKNKKREKRTYDSSGNLTQIIREVSNDTIWIEIERNTWTYDNRGNHITHLNEIIKDNISIPTYRYFYTYDKFDNELMRYSERYKDYAWNIDTRRFVKYNEGGYCLSLYGEAVIKDGETIPHSDTFTFWDSKDREFRFHPYQLKVYYKGATGVGNEDESVITKQYPISPNPASDYIEIVGVEGVVGDVTIYDVLGIEHPATAWHPSAEGNVRIDVSALAQGVYFVKIGGKMLKFIKI